MTCTLCNRVALYVASGKGFCKVHKHDAVLATTKECKHIISESVIRRYESAEIEQRRQARAAQNGWDDR